MAETKDQDLERELRSIVAGIVEIEPEKISREANFVEDLGMDSMMALEILASIEKKYKIRIAEEKLGQIKNLNEVIKLAKEYIDK